MKKLMVTLGAVAAATVLTAYADETPVQNQPAKPEAAEVEENEDSPLFEVALQLDINSAYVSHNRIFSDAPVAQYDIWMQANLPENFGWLAFDIWASQELHKKHSSVDDGNGGKRLGGIGEFDYEIVYGNSIGPVNFTASHLWYTYPRCGWHSQRFWTFGVDYDNEFVIPSIKYFWEYDLEGDVNSDPLRCFMIDFALSRSFDITEQLSLTFTTKMTLYSWKYAEYISRGELNDTAFGGWDNGVALNYAITDNLSIGGHLNFLYKIDHRVRHCPDWDSYSTGGYHSVHNGFLYGGISVSYSF